jgi:hypothetical protein
MNTVPISQKSHRFCSTNIKTAALFRKIISVYSDNEYGLVENRVLVLKKKVAPVVTDSNFES